ncbi:MULTISPECIES: type III secretion apparatus needle protein [Providencia]|uniref:type III secretion apparatus needle protein n=1 Tax=Providencia TaxID=586 RepID=UPI00197CE87C|nr:MULTISPECIES: type III secretion apparatus needle protein [Providencia]MBN4866026.1 type III secretion apparatus needle protein [Providencia stuartii]MBN4875348.1 type III secretion apparatus needle protein [Providencia stuartii]MBN4880039.1 type III secretion apparatus needle protein [Providencia stuartii]MBN4884440.1 type III secretion apparatus needle protein [Providencia stuartii]
MAIGLTSGEWQTSTLEDNTTTTNNTTTANSKWGMMYASSAGLSARTKVIADELKGMIDNPNIEVDNPLVLGKITALSGNYNMARQLQSNVMKSIKDAAQAIIRNV